MDMALIIAAIMGGSASCFAAIKFGDAAIAHGEAAKLHAKADLTVSKSERDWTEHRIALSWQRANLEDALADLAALAALDDDDDDDDGEGDPGAELPPPAVH